jgi:hypothetical protein
MVWGDWLTMGSGRTLNGACNGCGFTTTLGLRLMCCGARIPLHHLWIYWPEYVCLRFQASAEVMHFDSLFPLFISDRNVTVFLLSLSSPQPGIETGTLYTDQQQSTLNHRYLSLHKSHNSCIARETTTSRFQSVWHHWLKCHWRAPPTIQPFHTGYTKINQNVICHMHWIQQV